MRHGVRQLVLAAAVLTLIPDGSGANVDGTDNADVIVYGRMLHWAIADGGGGAWRYDGEGGCVFDYDPYNSPTYRGSYDHHDHDDVGEPWSVHGELGDDWIYSPSKFDSGSLVCTLVFAKVETDPLEYETYIYGDEGVWNSGDNDTIFGCPTWHCHMWGNGGTDDITGGTASDDIDGQEGFDVALGGAGGDNMWGNDGNDSLFGEAGNDTIRGGNGNDHLYGGDDNDQLLGEAGTDYLYGQSGADDDCDGGTDSDYCGTSSPYYCEAPLVSCSTGG